MRGFLVIVTRSGLSDDGRRHDPRHVRHRGRPCGLRHRVLPSLRDSCRRYGVQPCCRAVDCHVRSSGDGRRPGNPNGLHRRDASHASPHRRPSRNLCASYIRTNRIRDHASRYRTSNSFFRRRRTGPARSRPAESKPDHPTESPGPEPQKVMHLKQSMLQSVEFSFGISLARTLSSLRAACSAYFRPRCGRP